MSRFDEIAEIRSFSPAALSYREEIGLSRKEMEGVLARWMEREPRALVVVNEQLAIQWANPASQALIGKHVSLIWRNGHLHARRPSQDNKLRAFVRRATSAISTMCLVSESSDENMVLFAVRLESPREHLVGLTLRSAPAELVVHLADLALAFGLTRTEVQVARSLLGGRTAEETADELRVSIETVRTHIKRSYAKLAVSSREAFFHKLAPYIVTLA